MTSLPLLGQLDQRPAQLQRLHQERAVTGIELIYIPRHRTTCHHPALRPRRDALVQQSGDVRAASVVESVAPRLRARRRGQRVLRLRLELRDGHRRHWRVHVVVEDLVRVLVSQLSGGLLHRVSWHRRRRSNGKGREARGTYVDLHPRVELAAHQRFQRVPRVRDERGDPDEPDDASRQAGGAALGFAEADGGGAAGHAAVRMGDEDHVFAVAEQGPEDVALDEVGVGGGRDGFGSGRVHAGQTQRAGGIAGAVELGDDEVPVYG